MDFVASRKVEKQFGWRNRVSDFLQVMGVTVFDPWFKPDVRGLHEYGREDVKSGERIRDALDVCRRQKGRAGTRSGARNSSGRRCTLTCAWWTPAISQSRIAPRTFTASARRTRSSWPRCNTSLCCSSVRRWNFPALHELRDHLKADAKGRGAARTARDGNPHQGEPAKGCRACGTCRW
jgi:hypothetical protein